MTNTTYNIRNPRIAIIKARAIPMDVQRTMIGIHATGLLLYYFLNGNNSYTLW